jgi:predicted nucleic acid-binding protein
MRILLEGKSHGLIENVKPQLNLLEDAGMWVSEGIRQRLLALAGEK